MFQKLLADHKIITGKCFKPKNQVTVLNRWVQGFFIKAKKNETGITEINQETVPNSWGLPGEETNNWTVTIIVTVQVWNTQYAKDTRSIDTIRKYLCSRLCKDN